VTDSRQHNNESSGSLQGWKFLEQLSDYHRVTVLQVVIQFRKGK